MAVYDGFFDAVMDEDAEEYDRTYQASDFTGYFSNVIGSGVCVHGNPDSFKVRLENGKAVVSRGYLFIKGYWLKNDADYEITLPGTGTYAIVARLSLADRMIKLEAQSVAQAYPDSLVLAIVSPVSAKDTRYNTDICGVIDTAGDLSSKVEWALNYIDTEIDSKLQQVEADIAAQGAKLDAKIAEVQAVADSITPPPIGSIKFSASQNVDDTWLKCDGSFVNEADYPELVAALGKLTPSGDKFQLISNGEIGPQISNGVVYDGRMWVYSYSSKKLYGVDLAGTAAIEEITLTSEDANFNDFIAPSTARPICLSIIPHKVGTGAKVFLSQIKGDKTYKSVEQFSDLSDSFLIFHAEFSSSVSSMAMESPLSSAPTPPVSSSYYTYFIDSESAVPCVISYVSSGAEHYCCVIGRGQQEYTSGSSLAYNHFPLILDWEGSGAPTARKASNYDRSYFEAQRIALNEKNQGEAVYVDLVKSSNYYRYEIHSEVNGLFDFSSGLSKDWRPDPGRESELPINIAGSGFVLYAFDKNKISYVSATASKLGTATVSSLPSAARVFVDAAAYLWGKDIYLFFVGTGIIFSRTLEDGSFGYLDTTSVLGTITQFGYLDYDQSEGTLYLLGQDTTNTVKVAKIVLNTLYDYANDGAWLPMIASDGVPAYIKAKGGGATGEMLSVTIEQSNLSGISGYAVIKFNGEILSSGTYGYSYPGGSGTFAAAVQAIQATNRAIRLDVNGTAMAVLPSGSTAGTEKSITLNVAPYIASGLTLALQQA